MRVVLVEPGMPIAAALQQEAGWRKVYEDGQAVVLEKQQGENLTGG